MRVTRILPRTAFSAADFNLDLEVENTKRRLGTRGIIVADRLLPFHERGVAIDTLPAGECVSERFRTRKFRYSKTAGRKFTPERLARMVTS